MLRWLLDAVRRGAYRCFLAGAWGRDVPGQGPSEAVLDLMRRAALGLPVLPRSVWIHGEGMGEFNAAPGLLERLCLACPDHRLVLTSSRAQTVAHLAQRHPHALCLPTPWDTSAVAERFFRRLNPHLLLLLEFADGFSPAVLRQARRQGVPVVVVNGRLLDAPRPLRYDVAHRLGLDRLILPLVDRWCVQTERVATRLRSRGVEANRLRITGNLKYDYRLPATPHPLDPKNAPVLVAACIHPDEEPLIFDLFTRLRQRHSGLRFVVAPLNVDRVRHLEQACQRQGLRSARTSRQEEADVLVVDGYGELAHHYARATVVLLGGSLTPAGSGHSLVEPAAHGKPIVLGPYTASQADMVETFRSGGGVVQVATEELADTLGWLLTDVGVRLSLGRGARISVEGGMGATERTWKAMADLVPATDRLPDHRPGAWKRLLKQVALSGPGQRLLKLRARRFTSWQALHDYLGRPPSILCLGNGPSSEDPGLWDVEFDCVFRVNWRWALRSFMPYADVIFTGDHRTLAHCRGAVVAFRTAEEEAVCLLRSLALPRWRRFPCLTVERLPTFLNERDWAARPSNGAVMVAAAVALRPARLILAGLDLFAHPAGAYPGQAEDNHYAPVHDRDVEVAILRRALAEHRGELTVLGTPLRRALGMDTGGGRAAA